MDSAEPIEETWYRTVLNACALEVDISRFAVGDHTIVGNKGISLSGGQRQRIALARALNSKNDIFILDDVFSAVDASTQQIIFGRIFGQDGLLGKLNATTVLITHKGHDILNYSRLIASVTPFSQVSAAFRLDCRSRCQWSYRLQRDLRRIEPPRGIRP